MSVEWAAGAIVVAIVVVGLVVLEQLRLMTQRLDRICGLISEAKWQWDEDAGRHELRYHASRSAPE